MLYGILKNATNTGLDSELQYVFSTPLSIISNQPAYVQDMLNLKRRANPQGVQRWEIEAAIASSNDNANYLVHSILNGYTEEFFVRMPQVYGVPLSTQNTGRLVSALLPNIDTFTLTGGVGLNVGEFVQFQGFSKVYAVVDGGVDGVGIRLSPSSRDTIPANTQIVTGGKVTMVARYDASSILGIVYTDGVLSEPGSVKLIEAL